MLPLLLLACAVTLVIFLLRQERTSIHYASLSIPFAILAIYYAFPTGIQIITLLSWMALIVSVVEVVSSSSNTLSWVVVAINLILALYSTFLLFRDEGKQAQQVIPPTVITRHYSPIGSVWQPPVLLPRSRAVDVPVHSRAKSMLPHWSVLGQSILGISSSSSSPSSPSEKGSKKKIYPSVRYPPESSSASPTVFYTPVSSFPSSKQPIRPSPPLPVEEMKAALRTILGESDMPQVARIFARVFFPGMKQMETYFLREFRTPDSFIDALNRVYQQIPDPYWKNFLRQIITVGLKQWNNMWAPTKKAFGLAARTKLKWVTDKEIETYRAVVEKEARDLDLVDIMLQVQAIFLREAESS